MIASMTGFARVEQQLPWGQVSWELRSVNHRNLDLQFRLGRQWQYLEPQLRQLLASKLQRGRVELQLQLTHQTAANKQLDSAQVAWLQQIVTQLQGSFPQAQLSLGEVLQWPGVLTAPPLDKQQVQKDLLQTAEAVVSDLLSMRQREGLHLSNMLQQQIAAIQVHLASLQQMQPQWQQVFTEKLQQRLEKLDIACDTARLQQEVAFLVQKQDITEEIQRLDSHCCEFLHYLQQAGAVGRRLDFLVQELLREANTIASKAPNLQVTQIAIELKVLIEQCREQVQNLE